MENNTTNIRDSFDYAAAERKENVKALISSLIEIHSHMEAKRIRSTENGKEYTCINNDELKATGEWIIRVAGELMGEFISLDRVNRLNFKLYKCSLKIRERETPSIKDLLS